MAPKKSDVAVTADQAAAEEGSAPELLAEHGTAADHQHGRPPRRLLEHADHLPHQVLLVEELKAEDVRGDEPERLNGHHDKQQHAQRPEDDLRPERCPHHLAHPVLAGRFADRQPVAADDQHEQGGDHEVGGEVTERGQHLIEDEHEAGAEQPERRDAEDREHDVGGARQAEGDLARPVPTGRKA
jgi:hypothetical protein